LFWQKGSIPNMVAAFLLFSPGKEIKPETSVKILWARERKRPERSQRRNQRGNRWQRRRMLLSCPFSGISKPL